MMTGTECNEPVAIGNGECRAGEYARRRLSVAADCPVRLCLRLVREADSGLPGAAP